MTKTWIRVSYLFGLFYVCTFFVSGMFGLTFNPNYDLAALLLAFVLVGYFVYKTIRAFAIPAKDVKAYTYSFMDAYSIVFLFGVVGIAFFAGVWQIVFGHYLAKLVLVVSVVLILVSFRVIEWSTNTNPIVSDYLVLWFFSFFVVIVVVGLVTTLMVIQIGGLVATVVIVAIILAVLIAMVKLSYFDAPIFPSRFW